MDFRLPAGFTPLAYERISGDTLDTAQALAAASYEVLVTTPDSPIDGPQNALVRRAEAAFVTVALASVRFRVDGGTPTAGASGAGHTAIASATESTSFVIEGHHEIRNFRVINADVAANSEVTVTTFHR